VPLKNTFATSYQEARLKFLQATSDLGLQKKEYLEPGFGVQGEVLAMDVAHLGPNNASRMLVLTSGCHGVEGYAGSAAQVMVLLDQELHQRLYQQDVSILLVHAINPYGFSYARRVTADNVDLNRNCVDFGQPLPPNPEYGALHRLLLPPIWPPDPDNMRPLALAIETMGMRRFQDAVTRGQYEHPDGIFFGGRAPTWSQRTLSTVLDGIPQSIDRIAWIDLHTGLGPRGVGERIFTGGGADDAQILARQWWGDITMTEDASAVSSALTGQLGSLFSKQLHSRLLSSITLEFGTCAPLEVLHALRADAWAHSAHGGGAQMRATIAKNMKNAFFIDSQDWKEAVLEQSLVAIHAAVDGLALMHARAPQRAF
jgi:hypothetical protein